MSPKELVDKTIIDNKVAIFSKSWCPYCRRVKALFKEHFPAVTPFVVELDERDDTDAVQDYLKEKTGQRSVPNVFIDGKHIGGCDDTFASFKKGELAKLLEA